MTPRHPAWETFTGDGPTAVAGEGPGSESRVRVFWLARLGQWGEVWHYMRHESSTEPICGESYGRRSGGRAVEWWRFGDWGDRVICSRCQSVVEGQNVVVVARNPE